MSLYTRIRGLQIKDADITVTQLANEAVETAKIKDENVTLAKLADMAGEAQILVADAGSRPVSVAVSGDITIIADGTTAIGATKVLDSMINDDVATGLAGNGLSASGGGMAVDLDELNDPEAISLQNDLMVIVDADNNSEKTGISRLCDALADAQGGIITNANKSLGLKLFNIPIDNIVVATADFVFSDAGGTTKRESIADLITAIAGTGLTATDGVLAATGAVDSIVEGDVLKEDETVNCNGSNTTFTLSETPVVNSVQVYLNGSLVQEGSGKDYVLNGTTVEFATAPADDDSVIVHYLKND